MNLTGSRILITGASGGIGSALALALASRGARLALVGRDKARLEAVCGHARNAGASAVPVEADLSAPAGPGLAVGGAVRLLGGLDAVVNCAGAAGYQSFDAQDPAEIARLVNLNLVAPMLLARAALTHFSREGRGRIVNVGSTFGSIAFPCFAAYSASKFGLRGFSEALRRELSGTGIGVSYVAPRGTRTGMNSAELYRAAERTGMKMDDPDRVAQRIAVAMERDEDEVYIGFPESLFVRVNGLFPRLVDGALRRQGEVLRECAALPAKP